jgi:hypothetical protein
MPQYEISDCGMVIEIELRQFRTEALITLDPAYCSSLILSYPWRLGEVQPCLQAKAKLKELHGIEYCTSAEQEGGRVGPIQGTPSSLRRTRKNKFLSLLS